MAKIDIQTGDRAGESVELPDTGEALVGTSKKATVRLLDKGVAFKHARFLAGETGFRLVDERSHTGTFVNGERLERGQARLLRDGEGLKFGPVEAKFTISTPAPTRVADDESDPAALHAALAALYLRTRDAEDEVIRLSASAPDRSLLEAELDQLRAKQEILTERVAERDEAIRALEERREDDTNRLDLLYRQPLEYGTEVPAEVLQLQTEFTNASAEVRELRQELQALRESSTRREDALLAERETLGQERAQARARAESAQADLEEQAAELRELEAELAALRTMRDALAAGAPPVQ